MSFMVWIGLSYNKILFGFETTKVVSISVTKVLFEYNIKHI